MTARRMFLLQLGEECVPKSVSVAGAAREPIWCPIVAVTVETDEGWVLLETGIGRRFLDDGAAQDAVYRSGPRPRGLEGEPLETALAAVGLAVTDIALAAVSHLHCDHTGGIPLLAAAGVPVAVHRDELAFARAGAGPAGGYFPPDFAEREPWWRILDSDADLVPGVRALETPGHTPGHVSFRVDLPETGTWLFAFDAADLAENLNERRPPGWTALPGDANRAAASLDRLLREAEDLDARLVPGHDGAFWRAVRHPPGGHR